MRLVAVMLPELGAGPDIAIIISHWFAARGDKVSEGERLVEIRVGPATFDVPCPVSGRLSAIREHEDNRVRPGAVLGFVGVGEEVRKLQEVAGENDYDRDSDRRNGLPPSSRRSS